MKISSLAIRVLLCTATCTLATSEIVLRGGRLGRLHTEGIVEEPEGLPKSAHTYDAQGRRTVLHGKEPGGGYTPGSPLYEKQKEANSSDVKALKVENHPESHAEGGAIIEHPAHAEGGEHKGHRPSSEGFALSVFLMGGVAALMIVFYLVNSPNHSIKAATWNVLNMTASIFVAVLIYGTIKSFLTFLLEPTFVGTIILLLTLFSLSYVGLHALLFFLKDGDEVTLQAAATLMAHITGFAAMYGFADSAELKQFEELDVHGILLLLVVQIAFQAGLSQLCDVVMKKISLRDGITDESEERWMDTCQETDDDVFCLGVSFSIVLLIRFLIRGANHPYEPGEVGNITHHETNLLLCFALLVAVAVVGGGVILAKKGDQITSPILRRAATNWHHLNSQTMAWAILFWAEWQLYVQGWEDTTIGGCLVVAVSLTVFSFAIVCGAGLLQARHDMGHSATRAIKSLELALGVLVGFSWERAFDVGFEELEAKVDEKSGGENKAKVVLVGMSMILLVIVAPAWRWFILPRSMKLDAKSS